MPPKKGRGRGSDSSAHDAPHGGASHPGRGRGGRQFDSEPSVAQGAKPTDTRRPEHSGPADGRGATYVPRHRRSTADEEGAAFLVEYNPKKRGRGRGSDSSGCSAHDAPHRGASHPGRGRGGRQFDSETSVPQDARPTDTRRPAHSGPAARRGATYVPHYRRSTANQEGAASFVEYNPKKRGRGRGSDSSESSAHYAPHRGASHPGRGSGGRQFDSEPSVAQGAKPTDTRRPAHSGPAARSGATYVPGYRRSTADQEGAASFVEFNPKKRGDKIEKHTDAAKSKRDVPSEIQRVREESDNSNSGSDVLEKLSGLSLKQKPLAGSKEKGKMAERPGVGTDGYKIALVANYFMVTLKDINVYHYDIDIFEMGRDKKQSKSLLSQGTTEKEDLKKNVPHAERQQKRSIGKAKCRRIISQMVQSRALQMYSPVYDGQKNIFTNQPLPFQEKTSVNVELEIDGRKKVYIISIQPVQKEDGGNIISLEPLRQLYTGRSTEIPQEVLLVLDTVMTHREFPLAQIQARNSFFNLHQDPTNIGSGLEIWFGYNQSVRFAEVGPVLVVNVAAKAFHKAGPVIHYVSDVIKYDVTRLPSLERWQIMEVEKALKNLRVKVTHQRQPRKYKVKGITEQSAKELMLNIDNKEKSVAQYFWEKYNYRLKYPHLPCLHMQTSNTSTYIPMETCEVIEGQVKLGKLSGDLTAKMIKQTAVPPRDRFDAIQKYREVMDKMSGNMKSFGLFLNVKLINLNGRVITAPALDYGDRKETRPDNRGVWRIEDGKQFYEVNKINAWILMSFASDRSCDIGKLQRYADYLISSSRKCGLSCGRPVAIKIFDSTTSTEEAIKYAKQRQAEFAIVVLSRRDKYHSYEEVKFLADFKYGLVTQCMEDKTLNRINDQITTNVCLKINVKLGGINHIFFHEPRVLRGPVMVLGADVIHWMKGLGFPSIASVVGSYEPTASKYALTCSIQEHDKDKLSQEIIKNMKDIMEGMLQNFENESRCIPEKIIFFRDGVSEGQFSVVIEREISAIQQACRDKYQYYIPLTYIVVQKRHQTRLRPKDPRDGAGKCGNVPPGTTVDNTITHPVFFDYFLCSHEGIQGTSKPAHYTVLHDDNKFSADELQEVSYFLCHIYARCTRSVSIPAPVLYADLAAARAKKYADLHITSDTLSSVSSEDSQRSLPPDVVKAIESMKSFKTNMFYV